MEQYAVAAPKGIGEAVQATWLREQIGLGPLPDSRLKDK
jgi:hypothetical protein